MSSGSFEYRSGSKSTYRAAGNCHWFRGCESPRGLAATEYVPPFTLCDPDEEMTLAYEVFEKRVHE